MKGRTSMESVIFKVRKVQFGLKKKSISANISESSNGTSYDQSLYEIHIVCYLVIHVYGFSVYLIKFDLG